MTEVSYLNYFHESLREIMKEIYTEAREEEARKEKRVSDYVSTNKLADDLGINHKRLLKFLDEKEVKTLSISKNGSANGIRLVSINEATKAIQSCNVI